MPMIALTGCASRDSRWREAPLRLVRVPHDVEIEQSRHELATNSDNKIMPTIRPMPSVRFCIQ